MHLTSSAVRSSAAAGQRGIVGRRSSFAVVSNVGSDRSGVGHEDATQRLRARSRLAWRALAVLILVLVATVGYATRASAASLRPQLRPPLPPPCPAITFIGARGSGESFDGFAGVGAAVDHMATVLNSHLAKEPGGMQTVADPYPADSVSDLEPSFWEGLLLVGDPPLGLEDYLTNNLGKYLSSIDTGITDAVALANESVGACPQTKLVLAGYSQGAMVIHQAELQLATSNRSTFRRIVGTLLLGDGDRVPYTRAHEFGTSLPRAEGIRTYLHGITPRDVPLPASTANICNSGDLVCDFNLDRVLHFSQAAHVHTSYAVRTSHGMSYAPVLGQAANWLAQRILR